MASRLTANGFEIDDFDTIYANKLADFRTVQPDLRDTDSNPLVVLLKYDSQKEYEANLEALSQYNDLSVFTAVGKALEDFVKWRGLIREGEKFATGKITINGAQGTIIPAFWAVETVDKIGFLTTNTISETIDISGILELEIKASVAGESGNVVSAAVTEQVEVITGITSISNANATSGGSDTETDTELRTRYFADIGTQSLFSAAGIKQYILDNTEAEKVIVRENDTDVTVSGRPPHSYEIYAVGDTDQNILDAAHEYKVLGIKSYGTITSTVDDITAGISRPTTIDLYLDIDVVEDGTWEVSREDNIKQAVIAYVESVDIEGLVELYNIVGAIYRNGTGIKSLGLELDDITPPVAIVDYQLGTNEIARLLETNININVTT